MAETKKNEAVEPTIDIEAIKAEIRAEIEAEIKADILNEVKPGVAKSKPETKKQLEKANEEVEIFIPLLPGGNDRDLTVTINGYTWQIKRGLNHKLPRKVVEVIQNSDRQMYAAYEYMESVKEEQYD